MKWLCACLAILFVAGSALAGEDPYIATVGNDMTDDVTAKGFYFSSKYYQFMYDQTVFSVPKCFGNSAAAIPVYNQFLR